MACLRQAVRGQLYNVLGTHRELRALMERRGEAREGFRCWAMASPVGRMPDARFQTDVDTPIGGVTEVLPMAQAKVSADSRS